MRFEPHDYQRDALAFMLEREAAALFADPGLGKTAVALGVVRALLFAELGRKVLIVAPLRVVISTWPAELAKWDQFTGLRLQVVHGPTKALDLSNDIFVVNPEGLTALFAQKSSRELDVLIVDESSKFKNFSAKRTRTLRRHLKQFRRRYIMSGTPSPNNLLDIFSQVFLLDRGAAWGKSKGAFKNRYFYPTDYMRRKWEPKPKTAEHVEAVLGPLALRLDADELLELPELVRNYVAVELPPGARKRYDQVENELFVELDNDDPFFAANAGVGYGYCRQVASGAIYRPDQSVETIHAAKLDAVVDLIDELQGKPVLVAFNYRHELAALRARLGSSTPAIAGGTSAAEGDALVQLWNRDELPILLVNPASVSHGLNLQYGSGRHIVWMTLTDNPENYEQLNKRILRQGVEGTVFAHHIIATETVDEVVLGTLGTKHQNQKGLLDALRDYRAAKGTT